MEAALLFRGTIVSAYGHIETRMGELSLRISRMPSYIGIGHRFPYSFPGRIKYLRKAFATGPLDTYQSVAESFFKKVEANLNFPHRAAHSRMRVPSDGWVTFTDIPEATESNATLRTLPITLPDLEKTAIRIARLSRLGQILLDDLEQTGHLPPI